MGDHCLEVEDMEEMISLFFTEPPHNSDGNINLFADHRVMTVLGYKTGAITGYTD